MGVRGIVIIVNYNVLEKQVDFRIAKREGLKYSGDVSMALTNLDRVINLGNNLYQGGVFQFFLYYLFDSGLMLLPSVKELLTIVDHEVLA